MKQYSFGNSLVLVVAWSCFTGIAVNAELPPNILILMADDLGFSDLGCYGGEIETPNLDALADHGLRYTQFYNGARCWPTRSSLLTGYYPQQIGRDKAPGIEGGGRGKRPSWARLLSEYLKPAGYRSYHSGKWHIDGMPIENGFDRSYYLRDQHRFFSPAKHYEDDQLLPPVKRGSGFYGTTAVATKAIEYLEQHKTEYADKPFFAYVAFAAPHFPLQALPDDIARIGDRYAEGWDVLRQRRWERIQKQAITKGTLSEVEHQVGPPYDFPESLKVLGEGEVNRPVPWNELTPVQKRFQETKMRIHAAMIERMDSEIGRIVDQVKSMNCYEDTLAVFLSDNGASAEIMVRGDGHDPNAPPGSADSNLCLGPGWSTVCNTPFRRHKTWAHEGGSHTPFIAHWPKGIAARGALRHDVCHVIDLVPTLLELAGVKPHQQGPAAFPGKSLTGTFAGDVAWDRKLWWYHQGNRAMRVGDWKIVAAKEEEWELFNLSIDPAETKNLAAGKPEKVQFLIKEWEGMLMNFQKVALKQKPGKKQK